MKISLLRLLADHLFGHRYYINIYNRRGTAMLHVSARIHYTRASATAEAAAVGPSFLHIETVSFRSHYKYTRQ